MSFPERRLCRIDANDEKGMMELADWVTEQVVAIKPQGGGRVDMVMPRRQLDEAGAQVLTRIMESRGIPIHITIRED